METLGPATAVPREKTAVVLIDMQEHFVCDLAPDTKEHIVMHQQTVLADCAKLDVPVVVLEFDGYGSTLGVLEEGIQSIRRSARLKKSSNDGFSRAMLRERLEEFGATSLLLMGINASYCVLDTAKSAKRLGFNVVTSSALIADQKRKAYKNLSQDWYRANSAFYTGPVYLR